MYAFLGQVNTILIRDLSAANSRWEYPILGRSRLSYILEGLCKGRFHCAIGSIDKVGLLLGEIELRLKLLDSVAIFQVNTQFVHPNPRPFGL